MDNISKKKFNIASYTSKIGNIELIIQYKLFEDGKVWMDYCHYEEQYIKMFIALLVKSIDDLIFKKYKTFVQKVTQQDWNDYLCNSGDDWKIIETDNIYKTIDIECSLKNATNNICKGLGFI